jgi:hypothetical protein
VRFARQREKIRDAVYQTRLGFADCGRCEEIGHLPDASLRLTAANGRKITEEKSPWPQEFIR